jgi:hypothetical protein|tara:strand:- start:381 stop:1007 length:627 start_codon:yes stop_codon:yes gene_type:complete
MSYSVSAQQARTTARNDLTIFNEVQALMKQVITDAGNGLYQTIVSDGTTMTESTPVILLAGTVENPTISVGNDTLIIAGQTITLGTSGLNLNAIMADINDALIPGLIAGKGNNKFRIFYTATAATTWQVVIGSGSANAALGINVAGGTLTAINPDSIIYNNVWQGLTSDAAKSDQMKQVITYFENLGYTIARQTNTITNSTFKWVINY